MTSENDPHASEFLEDELVHLVLSKATMEVMQTQLQRVLHPIPVRTKGVFSDGSSSNLLKRDVLRTVFSGDLRAKGRSEMALLNLGIGVENRIDVAGKLIHPLLEHVGAFVQDDL